MHLMLYALLCLGHTCVKDQRLGYCVGQFLGILEAYSRHCGCRTAGNTMKPL